MTDQNGKNFVNTILDAQKNMVDTLVENTKKVTKGNSFINETIEKSTETYNEWVNKQKEAVEKVSKKAEDITATAKESTSKVKEQAQNWFETQLNWTKKAWEMNQDFLKKATPSAHNTTTANPMEWMQNISKKMSDSFTQAQNAQQWWNLLQQYNPANASDIWGKTTENWTNIQSQYAEAINNSFTELQKNMQNTTTGDAYKNMIDVAAGFSKFNEMWTPFMKSIQEKSFSAEDFKKAFNFSSNKDLVDNFFGFMPEGSRQYMDQSKEMFTNNMKNFMEMTKGQFQGNKDMFAGMNPFAGQNVFENMMTGYQNMQSTFQNAVSPIAKMVTPNQFTKSAQEWSEIADRLAVYNIKNAEMQYMMYERGNKVMENLVANISSKIENGVEIKNITELYQEFLSISDKVFIELFESDEYSKLMAETSAMQLKLKKEMELQTEKMLSGLPITTRSEMDEMYKVIYDLKKQVHQLQKMMDIEPAIVTETETTAKAKTTKK